MKPVFQRKLAVEFVVRKLGLYINTIFNVLFIQDNLDVIKQKTSKAKKTLRSLISFMNERMNIEMRYAQSLHNLAKNGKIVLLAIFLTFINLINRWCGWSVSLP